MSFQTLETTNNEVNEEKRVLEVEKEELTKQLLQAKQKHLELLSKVEGLQAQAPEGSGYKNYQYFSESSYTSVTLTKSLLNW